jgi:hypothetical protein
MACLNGSALALDTLTGGFSTFHVLAVFSLATVAAGVIKAVGRRRWLKWMWRHYQYMAWSYVGLFAMALLIVVSGAAIFALQRRVLTRYSGRPNGYMVSKVKRALDSRLLPSSLLYRRARSAPSWREQQARTLGHK